MTCKPKCTKIEYHSYQNGNGNKIGAGATKPVLSTAIGLFDLPANCILLGVYYKTAAGEWKWNDLKNSADLSFSFALSPLAPIQKQVYDIAQATDAHITLEKVLIDNNKTLQSFLSCEFITQEAQVVSITNNSLVTQTIFLVYADYTWIWA